MNILHRKKLRMSKRKIKKIINRAISTKDKRKIQIALCLYIDNKITKDSNILKKYKELELLTHWLGELECPLDFEEGQTNERTNGDITSSITSYWFGDPER